MINPAVNFVDGDTGQKSVSRAAISFHELAESFGKVDRNLQYIEPGGNPGAHSYAVGREKTLLEQRPGFTQYPAGGSLRRKE